MKRFTRLTFAVIAWILLSGSARGATKTDNLNVSATSVAACSISITDVAFPAYDGTGPVNAAGNIAVTCPIDLPYAISLDAGLNFDGTDRTVSDGLGNNLKYRLFDPTNSFQWGDSDYDDSFPAGASVSDVGSGVPQSHTVNGVLGFSPSQPPPGSYSDTVNVIVHY